MKTTKKIFSLFNLFLFIGSFCFTSLSAFGSGQYTREANGATKQLASKQDIETSTCSQSVFEKNENETESENGMQMPAYVLPFFLSHFQFKVSDPTSILAKSLATSNTTPIYLSVCNFRI